MRENSSIDSVPTFGILQIGWYHQRPELKRSGRFDEVKAVVLEQCLSIGGTL